jgi:GNAT superfamily N-acetyltransferase
MPAPWPGTGALPGPAWQLRSMAVRADHRGTGVGAQVLAVAEDVAAAGGAAALWASARLEALGFYERAGWLAVGEVWIKPGIGPHRLVTVALLADLPRLRGVRLHGQDAARPSGA